MLNHVISFSHLVEWVLRIYSWVHIAAFILSWIQADLNNPLVNTINRITIPMWNWVRFRLPQMFASFAPIIALLIVIFAEISLPGVIRSIGGVVLDHFDMTAGAKNVVFYLLFGALYITSSIIWFIFLLSVLWFVFSIVNPPMNNIFVRAIWYLIDPLLTPIQRYLPRTRIDLSPVVLAVIALLARSLLNTFMIPIQSGFLI